MPRAVVAGSRELKDYAFVKLVLDTLVEVHEIRIDEVVSGGAMGVDEDGERWARERGIPVEQMKPDYGLYEAKIAPLVRNKRMAKYAAEVPDSIAVIIRVESLTGHSGSQHMRAEAKKAGLTVYEYIIDRQEFEEKQKASRAPIPRGSPLPPDDDEDPNFFVPAPPVAAAGGFWKKAEEEGKAEQRKEAFAAKMFGRWDHVTPAVGPNYWMGAVSGITST